MPACWRGAGARLLVKLDIFKKGFNYAQDGPGHRLVYHLQGCTMHCAWCSNPEGMAARGTLLVDAAPLLDSFCPHGAISAQRLDRERCAGCRSRECVGQNRNQRMRWSAQSYELEAIVDEAKRSVPLFFDGGGVTLSGGEATLQFGVVRRFLMRLKDEGIDTALETNATHVRLGELFPLLDTLIIDVKHHDERRLRATTGVGLAVIERNVARALAEHPAPLIRITLVGRVNDSAADARRFAAFFRRFDTRRAKFEFLAYHDYGRDKWAQCGLPYRIDDGFVSEQTMARFAEVFTDNALNVVCT
jgi:pyruvate formate lyase activating enzyme